MSGIAAVALVVWLFATAVFLFGLCRAAAGSPPAPEHTKNQSRLKRHRHETHTCKTPYLGRVGRRAWTASSFMRHHKRELVPGLARDGFRQRRCLLADETMTRDFGPARTKRSNL